MIHDTYVAPPFEYHFPAPLAMTTDCQHLEQLQCPWGTEAQRSSLSRRRSWRSILAASHLSFSHLHPTYQNSQPPEHFSYTVIIMWPDDHPVPFSCLDRRGPFLIVFWPPSFFLFSFYVSKKEKLVLFCPLCQSISVPYPSFKCRFSPFLIFSCSSPWLYFFVCLLRDLSAWIIHKTKSDICYTLICVCLNIMLKTVYAMLC